MGKTISYDTPFKSEPMSRKRIREIAERLKKLLKIPVDQPYVDVTKVLELICDEYPEFSFEIVNDDFFEDGVQAKSDVERNKIYLRESVYNGAAMNNGRDRITVAHEIFHILLHQQKTMTLYRRNQGIMKVYENPEWQAECFAGEFLMSYNCIKNMNIQEIQEKCKVSERAACYQLKHI